MLEYIEARASEPCHKTTLQSFHLALAFVERAGGIRASEGLAGDPIVVGALEEVTLAVTGGRVKPRRPALREPVIFTVVREMMVVDDSAEFYDRIYCWWLLVKTWASLRFDDHRGLIPGDFMLTSHGLSGVLSRTKTSGAGKATETLPVYVSSEAYIFQASWLSVGYFLWEQVPGKRDYFLVMPSADRSGTTAAEVRYPDAVAISRAILRGSPSIVWQEGRPSWGSGPLLEPTSVALWTEHSARASVPSWADCLATFPKDWLDHLGRWGGDGSAGYVRTYRSRVRKIQESVARALRECRGGTDFLDEEEIFEHMARFLRAGDLDEETIEKAKVRLRYFETISVNETADQIEDRKNEDISEVLALEAGDGESAGSAGDAAAAASSGLCVHGRLRGQRGFGTVRRTCGDGGEDGRGRAGAAAGLLRVHSSGERLQAASSLGRLRTSTGHGLRPVPLHGPALSSQRGLPRLVQAMLEGWGTDHGVRRRGGVLVIFLIIF